MVVFVLNKSLRKQKHDLYIAMTKFCVTRNSGEN